MKLLIKNGFLISESYYGIYDIEIENTKIKDVSKHIPVGKHNVIDAKGKWVFPGIIDVHTHFKLKGYGSETLEDFFSGTKTALCAGITTIIDYIIPQKNENLVTSFIRRKKEAQKSFTDYTFHSQIVGWDKTYPEQIKYLISSGIKSFKIFLPRTENWYIDDGKIYTIIQELSKYKNAVLEAHCENSDIIELLTEKLKNENKLNVKYFPFSRPNIVEYEAVRRFISIASYFKCNIYVVHITTKETMEEITFWKNQKNKKFNIYAETCPQYLTFTDEVFNREDNYLYTCCPTIKSVQDRESLWKYIKDGYIDVLATDNCVFSKNEKYKFRNNFTRIPKGLPGVPLLLYIVVSEGRKRNIHIKTLIKTLTSTPAKIFSLYPGKGDFIPGESYADLVIFTPREKWKVKLELLNTVSDYTPYEGMSLCGKIETVIFSGNVVVENNKLLISEPEGKFIKRR